MDTASVMVMIPNSGMPDGAFMDDAMAETDAVFAEHAVLVRYKSESGGDGAAGVAPSKVYANINTTMQVEQLTAAEISTAGGQYVAGDVMGTFRIQVYGAEGGASNGDPNGDAQDAGRYSDKVLFRGREYRIIGHPDRIHFGGRYYWKVQLRPNRP